MPPDEVIPLSAATARSEAAVPGAPPFDASVIERHRPDQHLQVRRNGARAAQCSLWWTDAPPLAGETLGVIGHFGAADELAARSLLETAVARLREAGCTRAVGPMDGNTWRSYRFVTERGDNTPFFLEPWNPAEWPQWWERAGFEPFAQYTSAVADLGDATAVDPRAADLETRLAGQGITFRQLDPTQFDAELDRIYDVSAVGFTEAILYTPLDRTDFKSQYAAVKPLVRPEFVWFAERIGLTQGSRPATEVAPSAPARSRRETLGFMFAIPDVGEVKRTGVATTLIAKTIAVRPECAGLGIGTVLFAKVHAAARAAGMKRVVHALMNATTHSKKLSAHAAKPLRGYTLYARGLKA